MINAEENKDHKNGTNFTKYTGIAFQMLATIGLLAFIGYKIDENRDAKKLIFTAIFGLFGVIVSLFQVVKSLTKNNK